jgi:riboflavin synthase alpha subunit
MSLNNDVRSFSSYTKGLHIVSEISLTEEVVKLQLRFPLNFQPKLEKRNKKYGCSALSVNGVYARISYVKPATDQAEYFEVVAKVAKEFFLNSTLATLEKGDKVNIGMISKNPKKWLLASSPVGKVRLSHMEIAKGHTYTKELNFECSKEIFERIQKLQYIGLNASGLMIREPKNLDGHYFFSVHIGKETCEKTELGKEDLKPGTEFTLTVPFIS